MPRKNRTAAEREHAAKTARHRYTSWDSLFIFFPPSPLIESVHLAVSSAIGLIDIWGYLLYHYWHIFINEIMIGA